MTASKHHIPRASVADAIRRRVSWGLGLSGPVAFAIEPATGIERQVTPAEFRRGLALYQQQEQERVRREAERALEDALFERQAQEAAEYDATHPWVISFAIDGAPDTGAPDYDSQVKRQFTSREEAYRAMHEKFGVVGQSGGNEWAWRDAQTGATGHAWIFSLDPSVVVDEPVMV